MFLYPLLDQTVKVGLLSFYKLPPIYDEETFHVQVKMKATPKYLSIKGSLITIFPPANIISETIFKVKITLTEVNIPNPSSKDYYFYVTVKPVDNQNNS